MQLLCLLFLCNVVLVYGEILKSEIGEMARGRLESENEVLSFIKVNAPKATVLLSFFRLNENGEILHREKEDGGYQKFLQLAKVNKDVAMGLIASDELCESFNVPSGTHFVQVVPEYSKKGKYNLHVARFYKDDTLAQDSVGRIQSMIQHDKYIYPMSSKQT